MTSIQSYICHTGRFITKISNRSPTSSHDVHRLPHWSNFAQKQWYPIPCRISIRQSSTTDTNEKSPFYKRIFGGKTQDQVDHQKETDEKIKEEERIIREIEMEKREARIRRKQNRSKLHYSHRNILKGEPPQVGLHMDWAEEHMTRAYKAKMFGQFGRTKTAVDPSICWPTPEEIAEEQERERILYDNQSLVELLEEDRKKQSDDAEAIIQREKEIDEKLARMDIDLNAWRSRVDVRKRNAQKEIDKRNQILAELRQEFGYNVNTNDPQFAEKIAEKEKEFSKRAKEEKKKQREEKKHPRIEQLDGENQL